MNKVRGYEGLQVFQLAKALAVEVHKMTIQELPKFEMLEQGSQIRRSSKSVVANLVEGFGRRLYKADFLKFITYAIASCDETKAHLDILFETDSLAGARHCKLKHDYEVLGAKLYSFRESVSVQHKTVNCPAS